MDRTGYALRRRYWSFTQLNQYLRCPLQYYFQRIAKLPQLTVGSGLVFGAAVHNGLAYIHNQMKSGEETSVKTLRREFCETWNDFFGSEIRYKSGETRERLTEKGLALLQLYMNEPVAGEIVSVEQSVIVPLMNSQGDYVETPMVAVFDLLTATHGTMQIHEFKTSARKYSQFEIDLSLQATAYANAIIQTFNLRPAIEYVVLTKTKSPKIYRLETQRNENQIRQLGDVVETVERAVNSKCFYPNPSPFNCGGCPYREPCRAWSPDDEVGNVVQLNGASPCSSK